MQSELSALQTPSSPSEPTTETLNPGGQEQRLPLLHFDGWELHFPERGRHLYLEANNLPQSSNGTSFNPANGIWLFRAESGSCGILTGKLRLTRNDLVVRGLVILHHGDQVEWAGMKGHFLEVRKRVVTLENGLLQRSCAYCHFELQQGEGVLCCPLCRATYHEDCWNDLTGKRCCSRDCRFSPAKLPEVPYAP